MPFFPRVIAVTKYEQTISTAIARSWYSAKQKHANQAAK